VVLSPGRKQWDLGAWFSQSKRQQHMEQAVAVGGDKQVGASRARRRCCVPQIDRTQ